MSDLKPDALLRVDYSIEHTHILREVDSGAVAKGLLAGKAS